MGLLGLFFKEQTKEKTELRADREQTSIELPTPKRLTQLCYRFLFVTNNECKWDREQRSEKDDLRCIEVLRQELCDDINPCGEHHCQTKVPSSSLTINGIE